MDPQTPTEPQLRAENARLRAQLEEAEDMLRAIRAGEVDALVMESPAGPQLFTLQGLDAESARFRGDILRQISEAVIAYDENRRVTYLNAAAERQYGFAASDALGRSVDEIFETRWLPPEAGAAAAATLREAGHWRGEAIHVKRSGEAIEVESSLSRLAAEDGTAAGVLAVIRDATERHRAVRTMRARTEEIATLLDVLPAFVWAAHDPECRVITGNSAANQLTGTAPGANVSQTAVAGEGVYLRQLKEDGTEYLPEELPMQRAVATGQPVRDAVLDFHFPDGRTVQALGNAVPLFDEHGRPRGGIAAFVDISERKRAEEALRNTEERFRKIFEHAATGIAISDWRGQYERCNPAYCAILGYPEEELRQIEFSALVHPDDRAANLAELRRMQEEELPSFEIENRHVRKDGAAVWVHQFVSLLRGDSGQQPRIVALITDVTKRRQTEEALREAKDAAEAANASKDRFLAVLSHELRTPLTPVLMAVAALEHDPDLRPEVREDLTMMKRNIELETKLIDDLLDLSRITSGKLALKIETVDLNEAIRHVCGICRADLLARRVRFAAELHGAPAPVAADSARLQQVLWNVLKNAIKFTPEGGRIRVTTSLLDGGRWEVRVEDSGAGISAEALPRIFDAFEQGSVAVTRQFGGLGLGLAICKALVGLHAGSIRAESAGPGKGATFIIELPGAAPAHGARIADAAASETGKPAQPRLLIVEDHADTARTLSRLLRAAGFAVITASSIASAVALAEHEPFDLLVSDLGLPDGNGCELIRRLRTMRPVRGIAMSGYGMDEDMRLSREAGFAEHLVKPIDIHQLKEAIQRVMQDKG